ncbi:Roadblock/LC7 domain protein [Opisthorchis viverrini]|uniref:Roadblock/LC7 domain protein n=2 Tax=Opisthorchis viverrini TaxID=6198 RepID=A0A1S8WR80_OPIVI|nr:Roadblock/LC7 domain protein [Opisthorchis viverrini]
MKITYSRDSRFQEQGQWALTKDLGVYKLMTTLGNNAADENQEIVQQIERIQNHKNVQGLILVNAEGNPIRSNLDNSTSLQYTRHMEELRVITDHVVRDLDPCDELVVLRVRTKVNEIMVLPEKGCLVVCIQAREDHLDEVRIEGKQSQS